MNKKIRKFIISLLVLPTILFVFASPISSAIVEPTGKLKPPSESFTPGEWFLGSTPPNYNPNRPPIVFVQGKNGSSTSWYGETTYHGINDMYTKAYEAGYQTVFVQLYDAAGNGSSNQYRNGQLLASMLAQISRHFGGQKVNIIAHSKGGPDTQAALIHYGAHPYVGRVITLGSPHHGSNLADLAYSWWAGWLGSLLGQNDDGTFSLQTGQMAEFRSVTDRHVNSRKNKYYTVAASDTGPAFSALATGGLYLSSYGDNDGLVNVWSTKLPYGNHLFTDSSLDHDNIRLGTAVFSRIEPYLRTASVAGVSNTINDSATDEMIKTAVSQYIHGGALVQNDWVEQSFSVGNSTAGNITILTASESVEVEVISPTGIVSPSKSVTKPILDEATIFQGATTHTFSLSNMEAGEWTVRMKTSAEDDAYLLAAQYNDSDSIILEMPGMVKEKDAQFTLKMPLNANVQSSKTTFTIHLVDGDGNEISKSTFINSINSNSFSGVLPEVPQSGVYNLTIDIEGKSTTGMDFNKTIVRSVYINK